MLSDQLGAEGEVCSRTPSRAEKEADVTDLMVMSRLLSNLYSLRYMISVVADQMHGHVLYRRPSARRCS